MMFAAGSGRQVCADAILLEGEAEVNESLLTGESDPVGKQAGDLLLSGSFVISGKCRARVEHVGSATTPPRSQRRRGRIEKCIQSSSPLCAR